MRPPQGFANSQVSQGSSGVAMMDGLNGVPLPGASTIVRPSFSGGAPPSAVTPPSMLTASSLSPLPRPAVTPPVMGTNIPAMGVNMGTTFPPATNFSGLPDFAGSV